MSNKFIDKVGLRVIPVVASWLIRLISKTMRTTYVNSESYRSLEDSGCKVIHAFWHGRLLMMLKIYHGNDVTVLVSKHRDGELIARTVEKLGIKSVRGSSSRGWFEGLRGILKAARSGGDLAITPDGPRGPARRAQSGVIQIASRTGLPIIPVAFNSSKKKLLRAGILSSSRIRSQGVSLYSTSLFM